MRSRKSKKQSNQAILLSTNNKNFTHGGRSDQNSVNVEQSISPFIKDEDVRLEKIRDSKFAAQKGLRQDKNVFNWILHHFLSFLFSAYQYGQRNDMVITAILEESTNGYTVTTKAPFEMTAAIKHYTKMLRRFTLDFPEEWALCHYSLGKIFTSDHTLQERSKCMSVIDHFSFSTSHSTINDYVLILIFYSQRKWIISFQNLCPSSFYFHLASLSSSPFFSPWLTTSPVQIFTPEGFPTMSALISLFEASLSRFAALLPLSMETYPCLSPSLLSMQREGVADIEPRIQQLCYQVSYPFNYALLRSSHLSIETLPSPLPRVASISLRVLWIIWLENLIGQIFLSLLSLTLVGHPRYQLEQAFTRFELGWLFFLQAELKSEVTLFLPLSSPLTSSVSVCRQVPPLKSTHSNSRQVSLI
jgi:hypothetical protein